MAGTSWFRFSANRPGNRAEAETDSVTQIATIRLLTKKIKSINTFNVLISPLSSRHALKQPEISEKEPFSGAKLASRPINTCVGSYKNNSIRQSTQTTGGWVLPGRSAPDGVKAASDLVCGDFASACAMRASARAWASSASTRAQLAENSSTAEEK